MSGLRIVIVCARFNEVITSALLDGAMRTLGEAGVSVEQIDVFWVPGSFELPLAALEAARDSATDAVICLGAVIRGETAHFEHISASAAHGIMQAGLTTGKPVIFGVLTTNNVEQAFERAGGKVGNKGVDAARAGLEMIHQLSTIKESRKSS